MGEGQNVTLETSGGFCGVGFAAGKGLCEGLSEDLGVGTLHIWLVSGSCSVASFVSPISK